MRHQRRTRSPHLSPGLWFLLLLPLGCAIDGRDVTAARDSSVQTRGEAPAEGADDTAPNAPVKTAMNAEVAVECEVGDTQCVSGTEQRECSDDGRWNAPRACASACSAGECRGECVPDATQCNGSIQSRQCSEDGLWADPIDCVDQTCLAGGCQGECTPRTTRCSSATEVELCSELGEWSIPTPCDTRCEDGSCLDECVAGDQRCLTELDTQDCNARGQWSSPTRCEHACDPQTGECFGECTPGDRECVGQTPRSCDAGFWQTLRACDYVCIGEGTCAGECLPGEARCNPGSDRVPQRCSNDGVWVNQNACPGVCIGEGECAECQAGDTTPCREIEPGSFGVCAERSAACGGDGFWQREDCSAGAAREVCDRGGEDEDCDGQVNEPPDCVPGFESISAGLNFACGIATTGSVSCWGSNSEGEIGDGSTENRARPVAVSGLIDVTHVSAGTAAACAVSSSGSARCWGRYGASGGTPRSVSGLSNVEALVVGELSTCALLRDGTVRCTDGPSADGFSSIQELREDGSRSTLRDVETIDTSHNGPFCALMRDGTARCWGSPNFGFPTDDVAVTIPGVNGARRVAAGASESCALLNDGGIVCWTGAGSAAGIDIPSAIAVDAGGHSCAVLVDRSVRCWGNLGDELVATPRSIDGISRPASISVGFDASCVVRTDGAAQCFGDNRFGQLGDGTSTGGAITEFLPPALVLTPPR